MIYLPKIWWKDTIYLFQKPAETRLKIWWKDMILRGMVEGYDLPPFFLSFFLFVSSFSFFLLLFFLSCSSSYCLAPLLLLSLTVHLLSLLLPRLSLPYSALLTWKQKKEEQEGRTRRKEGRARKEGRERKGKTEIKERWKEIKRNK